MMLSEEEFGWAQTGFDVVCVYVCVYLHLCIIRYSQWFMHKNSEAR